MNKAISLKTNFLWSRLARARAFEESGSNQDALKDYQYALLLDPTNQRARDGVARLMVRASADQPSGACPATEEDQYFSTSADVQGLPGEIAAIISATQTYNTSLQVQIAKIDRLVQEKNTAGKRLVAAIGASDDRKRMTDEVQRLNEASTKVRSRLEPISKKISDQESKIASTQGHAMGAAEKTRLKHFRQELAKLQSARTEAEKELQQKTSARDAAASSAQRKAAAIAAALAAVQRLAGTKDDAEDCKNKIKQAIDALNQKGG